MRKGHPRTQPSKSGDYNYLPYFSRWILLSLISKNYFIISVHFKTRKLIFTMKILKVLSKKTGNFKDFHPGY